MEETEPQGLVEVISTFMTAADVEKPDLHRRASKPLEPFFDPAQRERRVLELDGLRGIAIILVLFRHYGVYNLIELKWARGPGFGGCSPYFPGVDLFFVISGYLLGGRLLDSTRSPTFYSAFYLRRIRRTLAPYYCLLVSFLIALCAQNVLWPILNLELEWPFGTYLSMAMYVFFLQSVFIAVYGEIGPRWLGSTWSLAVQEQFYLLMPLLVRLIFTRWGSFLMASVIGLGPLSRLIVVLAIPSIRWEAWHCLLFCRIDTLGIGLLGAYLINRLRGPGWPKGSYRLITGRWAVLFFGAVTMSVNVSPLSPAIKYVVTDLPLAVFYLSLVILAHYASEGAIGEILRMAALRQLGVISYGVFLWHQVIRDVLFYAVFGIEPTQGGWETSLLTVEAFLLTVLVATLARDFIGKPLMARGAT